MEIKIKIDEVQLLNDLLQNLPECSESFYCRSYNYKEHVYILVDREDGKEYILTMDKAKIGLEKFLNQVADGKFPGFRCSVDDLLDAGNWDASIIDALLQMSVLGEVIYG